VATRADNSSTDLVRDGYAVVKGTVEKQKALAYAEEIKEWLEGFGLGYKRDDPSTNREECLPIIHQKGLLQAYGATHESFTWAVRSEPGVISAFETLYQDPDLICSFDAINVSLANRKDLPANSAWPHQDQGKILHPPNLSVDLTMLSQIQSVVVFVASKVLSTSCQTVARTVV